MSLSSLFRKNNKQEIPDDDKSYSRATDEPTPKRTRAKRKAAVEDDAADPVLPEKKRARRRLIGAVALVLAAVIGLPMVLDSEPKPIAQDIDIKIPSKDQAPSPRRLPQAAALDPSEQILEPASNARESSASATPPESAASPGGAQSIVSPAHQDKHVAASADKPATQSAKAELTDAPASKPVPTAKGKVAAADTHAAINDAKTSSKPETHGKDAKAVTKPAANDRESERAMAILEGKGPAKAETAKSASDHKQGKYSIQVAALSSQDKVNELRGKLKAAGIASQTQKVPTASGERIRVRVGPFASKEDAEKMRARLAKQGMNGSLVPLSE
jgi:DedD protein